MIEFRPAQMADVEKVLPLYEIARKYMRKNGNMGQWTGSYPNREAVEQDIKSQSSYLYEDEKGVACTFYLSFSGEPTYAVIDQGAWLNDAPYGVIHRLAVSDTHRGGGFALSAFSWAEEQAKKRHIYDLRVDTHQDNKPMQSLVQKAGFVYCGIIYLENGDERLAYQKSLLKA